MSDVLVRSNRDPLFGMSSQELIQFLRSALTGRVKECYVFGSFARNELHSESDIDLILVADTSLPFPERGLLFSDLRDRVPSLEILVYTPEEFAQLTTDPSPGFWTSVVQEMVRVL
ncbi:MAG: nucleotidyltransferase domain-containing protein [Spirochaetes bacterium]|nr:nucleotidyltransferase domain-containing protein [Spirochaetota bacterium]